MYGCRLYNFDYTVWFESEEEAVLYGIGTGFQFVVEKQ